MPGIDAEILEHYLDVDLKCQLVKQKKCSFALERQKATMDEIDKLLKAGFIREVLYLK